MSKIMKDKSVVNSKAGEDMCIFAYLFLCISILSVFFDMLGLLPSIDCINSVVAVCSFIAGIVGFCLFKSLAKIMDYAEAIYKSVNPNYEVDKYVKAGYKFMPGEIAITDDGRVVTIEKVLEDRESYGRKYYTCKHMDNDNIGEYEEFRLVEISEEQAENLAKAFAENKSR